MVGDVKYSGLDQPNEAVYYEPAAEGPFPPVWLVVRTRGAASAFSQAISAQVRSLDPGVPISEIASMSHVLHASVELPRFRVSLMSGFAAAALLLACVGLYGTIAHYVAQRTHEIGIRMALGATSLGVLGVVVGHSLRLALAGVAAGMLGAIVLVRILKTMLFDVRPFDPPTLVAVALLLTSVAVISAWLPARRASRIDPMDALREE